MEGATIEDMTEGPTEPLPTVLQGVGETIIVAFRRRSLLPLDDGLCAIQPSVPVLTRAVHVPLRWPQSARRKDHSRELSSAVRALSSRWRKI